MSIPNDYEERVYAGVLGKLIGVYLGRPFEGWRHRRIEEELGEIQYYVNDRMKSRPPLVVADDDVSGTFTFVRALEDHGISADITAEQIGRTWLNYLIQERTILWWGGMGTSTEHTTFLRLKQGIPAPRSGSMALNGKVVAEQIGSQIFIDGWAMVAPGEPELAADLARKAAGVSHDGEAIYGAQALAAMESAAFYESDLKALMAVGLSVIPDSSVIARLYGDLREWHAADGDWRKTFARVEERYGYDTYGGGCHMIPNHAVIVLALLYGDDDFQRSLMIANTAGWDTDCNSGNVGCFMGIKNGLAGIDAGPDWRGPVADKMFKISADGGDSVTDAVRETYRLCRMGRTLLGEGAVAAPKDGARYHFSLPGSVQGFEPEASADCAGTSRTSNIDGSLRIALDRIGPGRPARVSTPVYITPDVAKRGGYRMISSPSVFPGQTLRAEVALDEATSGTVDVRLYAQVFPDTAEGEAAPVYGPVETMAPGSASLLQWALPDTEGLPIVRVGVACAAPTTVSGALVMDRLTWQGVPALRFFGPRFVNHFPPAGWTDGVSRIRVGSAGDGSGRVDLIQDEGRGLLITGTRDWENYAFSATVAPHLIGEGGIAVRVNGMRRFYGLLLTGEGTLQLLKCYDGDTVLADQPVDVVCDRPYGLRLEISDDRLKAFLDGMQVFAVTDSALASGAVGLISREWRSAFTNVEVRPL